MNAAPRPVSLVAERAVRFLRDHGGSATSVVLAAEVLATKITDEARARTVLEAAFAGDTRLTYREGAWHRERGERRKSDAGATPAKDPEPVSRPRVMLRLVGGRPTRGRPFELLELTAVRLDGADVTATCAGEAKAGHEGGRLRETVFELLDGAVPVVHDPPGSLRALERWLEEPLEPLVSLRVLGRARLGLPASHDLEALLGRLDLPWRESDDPLEIADTLDACLESLRLEAETLDDLVRACSEGTPSIDWSRFSFERGFLRTIPPTPGTYRFYDRDGELVYVGKTKNLHQRVGSYFRRGATRSRRVKRLLEVLYRIELEPSGSDLEAVLREARQIAKDRPSRNVQRAVHPRTGRAARLRSILILEPAATPWVLRAYLIRDGRFIGKVGIGPRGGGLKRIERLLEDHFFSMPTGPTPTTGADIEVEMVARWLARHRDRVVALDPTDLPSAAEVTDRLRWFLSRGSPFDPDGSPITSR